MANKSRRSLVVARASDEVDLRDGRPVIPVGKIEQAILLIRGERIILDSDLSRLFGVDTKVLNQAVRRNMDRFPRDFLFRLTQGEKSEVVTNCDHLERLKFSPVLPWAFTEHGAIMAANVLNSPQAIRASVIVVRAFIRLRRFLFQHKELAAKLVELERRMDKHDRQIMAIIDAIRELTEPVADPPRKPIGFHTELEP
jgi:hypothetical protein